MPKFTTHWHITRRGRERLAARNWERHADNLAEALRLTQEYVGDVTLPAREGWSWYDALEAHKRMKGSPDA